MVQTASACAVDNQHNGAHILRLIVAYQARKNAGWLGRMFSRTPGVLTLRHHARIGEELAEGDVGPQSDMVVQTDQNSFCRGPSHG